MKKGFLFIGIALLLGIAGFSMRTGVYSKYCILLFTAAIVSLLVGIRFMFRQTGNAYERNIKDILNTFDSVLVKSSTVPDMTGRSIIELSSIDDLVDAQLEIRKPICYLKQVESCSFVLLDDKVAYIYIEKVQPDVVSPVEIELNNLKIQRKREKDIDSEMLESIDKTTIVKLSNQKSYKVSPVRKKEQEQQVQKQEQQEEEDLQYTQQIEVQHDPDAPQIIKVLEDVTAVFTDLPKKILKADDDIEIL